MSSQSTSDGSYTLTVTFKIGTNLDMAQVRVQNRVALAMPNLPDVVRSTGITTRRRSPEILMTVGIYSPNDRYGQVYLSNYAVTRSARRTVAHRRHRRCHCFRPARLCHADLDRSR